MANSYEIHTQTHKHILQCQIFTPDTRKEIPIIPNICSEEYYGPYEESEEETQNIVKFYKLVYTKQTSSINYYLTYFRSLGNVVVAVDWHSNGQFIFWPYGKQK